MSRVLNEKVINLSVLQEHKSESTQESLDLLLVRSCSSCGSRLEVEC